MSISTTTDHVPTLLNRLKKTFEEIYEDVSSAKDVKKMIDHLMTQFPLSQQWEKKLRDRFSQLDRYSSFRSIRDELDKINDHIHRLAAEADQDVFQAMSVGDRDILPKPDEDSSVKCLRLNYEFFVRPDRLNHDPRICLYLAIFPKKAVLRKWFLIYWWIGEGFVEDEEEGEKVFQELLDLELLIPDRTHKCPRVSKCRISPWFRYILLSEAKKAKLLYFEDGKGIPRFAEYYRSTCLIAGHTNLASVEEAKHGTLRTIFNVNERYLDFQPHRFAELKRLVVLQLGRWQASPTHHIEVQGKSFLTGLKTQKDLKYLSLRGISRITSLPDSISELVSLQILDLKACHNLETLPAAIASLTKLTHLDVSECYLLDSMPKGLHKLTSLQVLKGFIIGSSLKTPIGIKHLQKSLKRLSIHIGSEASIQEEEFDKLKELKELKCLKISWGKVVEEKHYSLSFPAGLQKLDLEGIPHETMPEWLKPSNLRKLEKLSIKGGKLKKLTDQGEQWNVKYLVLKYTNIQPIDVETLRLMFPSLQYLKWSKQGEEESAQNEWINKDGTKTHQRRRSIFVWLAYLLADWAAGYCIGLITKNEARKSTTTDNDFLVVFWGPFLLLHLGGPDTISAFALEDNELWLRHLLALLFQSATAAYVFFLTLPHNTLWLPTTLMFIAGLIKYVERIHALYVAAEVGLPTKIIMISELHQQFAEAAKSDAEQNQADKSLQSRRKIIILSWCRKLSSSSKSFKMVWINVRSQSAEILPGRVNSKGYPESEIRKFEAKSESQRSCSAIKSLKSYVESNEVVEQKEKSKSNVDPNKVTTQSESSRSNVDPNKVSVQSESSRPNVDSKEVSALLKSLKPYLDTNGVTTQSESSRPNVDSDQVSTLLRLKSDVDSIIVAEQSERLKPFVDPNEVTFDQSLLLWHIATCLCYAKDARVEGDKRGIVRQEKKT
ncbi:hypothetical protein K1719_032925 [Acacia pycnantha]|nr:hypothetical protein K1719_032925 [Acacia pycnantha]